MSLSLYFVFLKILVLKKKSLKSLKLTFLNFLNKKYFEDFDIVKNKEFYPVLINRLSILFLMKLFSSILIVALAGTILYFKRSWNICGNRSLSDFLLRMSGMFSSKQKVTFWHENFCSKASESQFSNETLLLLQF